MIACAILPCVGTRCSAADEAPVAAPITTDLAGRSGSVAAPSAFRVLCPKRSSGGTGFLHKSGVVITAYHVVSNCTPSDVILLGMSGRINVTNIIKNADLDLAILAPEQKVNAPSLSLSTNDLLSIGSQVSTWGYPAGYNGLAPLLSSGYLSGFDVVTGPSGKPVNRLVVNAAFNSGNSGGPLVDIDQGVVIGVVASKLAPLPPHIEDGLNALRTQPYGFSFVRSKPDGTEEVVSQAKIIEEVLRYLRSQTQLVIGHAVPIADLRAFLSSNRITP